MVSAGKKWLALHGTNSALDFTPDGVNSPRCFPRFVELLGSQFIAHPPIQPYTVETVAPDHPLVSGVGEFQVDDELYLSEMHGEIEPLLATHFSGEASGFVEKDWPGDEPRVVAYLHPVGAGMVYYRATPQYYELLRRGIQWAKAPVGEPVRG
jgi:type 1 glutamine amidotransferase